MRKSTIGRSLWIGFCLILAFLTIGVGLLTFISFLMDIVSETILNVNIPRFVTLSTLAIIFLNIAIKTLPMYTEEVDGNQIILRINPFWKKIDNDSGTTIPIEYHEGLHLRWPWEKFFDVVNLQTDIVDTVNQTITTVRDDNPKLEVTFSVKPNPNKIHKYILNEIGEKGREKNISTRIKSAIRSRIEIFFSDLRKKAFIQVGETHIKNPIILERKQLIEAAETADAIDGLEWLKTKAGKQTFLNQLISSEELFGNLHEVTLALETQVRDAVEETANDIGCIIERIKIGDINRSEIAAKSISDKTVVRTYLQNIAELKRENPGLKDDDVAKIALSIMDEVDAKIIHFNMNPETAKGLGGFIEKVGPILAANK